MMKDKAALRFISFSIYIVLGGFWQLSEIEGPRWFYYALVVLFGVRDVFSFIQGQLSND